MFFERPSPDVPGLIGTTLLLTRWAGSSSKPRLFWKTRLTQLMPAKEFQLLVRQATDSIVRIAYIGVSTRGLPAQQLIRVGAYHRNIAYAGQARLEATRLLCSALTVCQALHHGVLWSPPHEKPFQQWRAAVDRPNGKRIGSAGRGRTWRLAWRFDSQQEF